MTGLVDTFGPFVDYGRIEDQIRTLVVTWIDTYLLLAERDNSITDRAVMRPRSWRVDDEIRKLPEDVLPAVVVISPGDADVPTGDTETLDGVIDLFVIAYVKGAKRDDSATVLSTRRLARLYGAALATLIDHKTATVSGVQLASRPVQRFDEGRHDSGDYIGSAAVGFRLHVDQIRARHGGPTAPVPAPDPVPPFADGPEVETVNVDLISVGYEDSI